MSGKRGASPPNFTRRREDFSCRQCGAAVVGDGYTNHCPNCLWSLHVDVTPGDRSATCGGMMEPVGWEQRRGEERIKHRCQQCGEERWCRISPNDSRDALVAMVRNR